jgi:hypothetical protein
MYVILSERIGTVGAFYDADSAKAKGVDIAALIAGGFIGEPSPTKAPKPSKVKTTTETEE